jgi:hypothetical protein
VAVNYGSLRSQGIAADRGEHRQAAGAIMHILKFVSLKVLIRKWGAVVGLVLTAVGVVFGLYLPTIAATWSGPEILAKEHFLQVRYGISVFLILIGTLLQICAKPSPLTRNCARPGGKRIGRGFHGARDIFGAAPRHLGDWTPVRWIFNFEPLARNAVDPFAE